jgi:minor extracellular serine protease Vpr
MRTFLLFVFSISSLLAQFVPGRFIVELKDEAVLDEAPGKRLARRSAMRAAHTRLQSALGARGFRTLGSTEMVANTMTIEGDAALSENAPEELARQYPEIRKVHRVREFHMSLDRAAALHGVTAAWERLGLENAGAGVKVGILDSGIQINHPGFSPGNLTAPAGYPKVSAEDNLPFTNGKVIVARSYPQLWSRQDADGTARDRVGHGTAVAMSAAGSTHQTPFGDVANTIAGMAPAAHLGVYKIFGSPGVNDGATDAAILQAIEDSISDGMDVINLSFGSLLAGRPEDDVIVRALARAESAGVIAVVAAGNDGPGAATLASPATAPTALSVGAQENDRIFSTAVQLPDNTKLPTRAGTTTPTSGSLRGLSVSLVDLDPTQLACNALPVNSLTEKIAVILRGTCTFETKVNNAARAGAKGAIIVTSEAQPVVLMDLVSATLPAVMLSYADGSKLLADLRNSPGLEVEVQFSPQAVPSNSERITTFSSKGPFPGLGLKPDLLAVGADVLTAAQSVDPRGDVYSANGYLIIDGTSFSAPIAAGAMALLKSARPGFSPAEYRSLLVHSARPLAGVASLSQSGAGVMRVDAALQSGMTVSPLSLDFAQPTQSLRMRNWQSEGATYSVGIEPLHGALPSLATSTLELAAGASAELQLSLDTASLPAGTHEGYVVLTPAAGQAIRVPYWFGKASEQAKEIQTLNLTATGRSGNALRNLIFFRVLDANGISLSEKPKVSVVSGTGRVNDVESRDSEVAGAFGLNLTLGLGPNVFEVDAGNGVTMRLTVRGN